MGATFSKTTWLPGGEVVRVGPDAERGLAAVEVGGCGRMWTMWGRMGWVDRLDTPKGWVTLFGSEFFAAAMRRRGFAGPCDSWPRRPANGCDMNRQTFHAKNNEVAQDWWVVDASDQVLGRLASRLAVILMGKHKPEYTPHHDVGDFVVVTNASKLRMTGNKADQKFDKHFSGYPSGQTVRSYRWMLENRPERLLETAVRRMLPKNKLAAQMLKKLKVYSGEEHPHQAQQPQPLESVA